MGQRPQLEYAVVLLDRAQQLSTRPTRLPAGATVVVVTSTISDPLLDILSRVKRSGHAVTILHVGDSALSMALGGVAVHHIGGEETWKDLLANNSRVESGSSQVGDIHDIDVPSTSSLSL